METHIICDSYRVRRLCPSIHWHMNTSQCSCYRWLHSDTGSAADSLLRKTLEGILGKKTQEDIRHKGAPLFTHHRRSTHLLCSWVRSSRACTHTAHWPGGRCHRCGSYRFGYILPHRNRLGTLPGEGQTISQPRGELCWSKVEIPVSGKRYGEKHGEHGVGAFSCAAQLGFPK